MTYDTRSVTRNDDAVESKTRRMLRGRRDEYAALSVLTTAEVELKTTLGELARERRELDRVVARFEAFLASRSVHPCDDDAVTRCIDWCSRREQQRGGHGATTEAGSAGRDDFALVRKLVGDRDPVPTSSEIDPRGGVEDLEPRRISELLVGLYQLPKTGPMLNRMMIEVERGDRRAIETSRVVFGVASNSTVASHVL